MGNCAPTRWRNATQRTTLTTVHTQQVIVNMAPKTDDFDSIATRQEPLQKTRTCYVYQANVTGLTQISV